MAKEHLDLKEVLLKTAKKKKILLHPEILSEAYVPERLLFRDEELEEVTTHAGEFMFHSISKNIVIHGPPGAGKTVAMLYLQRTYNEVAEENNIPTRAIYLSAKDRTYFVALKELGSLLGIKRLKGKSISEIYNSIKKYVQESDMTYLLIVDEIDKLKASPFSSSAPLDSLVYALSRLNEGMGQVKIMLFLVTNNPRTVERLSAPSFSSLSPIFIHFRDYNTEERYAILKDRVEKAFAPDTVEDAALRLLAALVSRESRDLRWAFLVLKEAASIAMDKITEKTIWKAVEQIDRNVLKQIVTGLPVDDQLLLLALATLSRNKRRITSSDLYHRYKELCDMLDWPPKTMNHVVHYIAAKLESLGLLSRHAISIGRHGRTQIFTLGDDPDRVIAITIEMLKQTFQGYEQTSMLDDILLSFSKDV